MLDRPYESDLVSPELLLLEKIKLVREMAAIQSILPEAELHPGVLVSLAAAMMLG